MKKNNLFFTSLLVLFSVTLLNGVKAFAFPEAIRFGYNNCQACHVSPSGAGLLTSYGRSLSSELLNTWGVEKDTGIFWGAVERESYEKKNILFGGDIRSVQLYQDTPQATTGQFVKMQAHLTVGYVQEKWGIVSDLGEIQGEGWVPYTTSIYGIIRPTDQISVRAGRFVPQYGIYTPNHTAFIKSFMGLGLTGNRETAELQWTDEAWTFNFSTAQEYQKTNPEKSNDIQVQYSFKERFKVAGNAWQSTTDTLTRTVAGAWALLGFTKNIFWNTELDWQTQRVNNADTNSFASYNKAGYTLMKGLDAFLISEHLQTNLSDLGTITDRNGIGMQFYPVAHVELVGAWSKVRTYSTKNQETDYAWILFHYYL
jgi:hypothetical protein